MNTIIESPQNKYFKIFSSLLTSKGLKKEKLFLLSGRKLVEEYLKNPTRDLLAEIIHSKGEFLSKAPQQYIFTSALFRELDELGTGFNILVLKQREISPWKPDNGKGLTVLCPLSDPGNVGALMRTCEAFGTSSLVLLKEAANPYLPKSVRGSSGSVLRLPLFWGPSIQDIGAFKTPLVLLDKDGTPLHKYQWPKDALLLVGEEGRGVPTGLKGNRLSIPIHGIESLNAVVAASIAIYQWSK